MWSRYVQPPVIPGHEFIGEVVKLGKGQCVNNDVCVVCSLFRTVPHLILLAYVILQGAS